VPSSADNLLAKSFAFEPLLRARLHHALHGDAALIDDGLQEIYARFLVAAESGSVRVRRLRSTLLDLLAEVVRKTSVPAAHALAEPPDMTEAVVDDTAPPVDDLQILVEAAALFPPTMRQAFTLRKVYGQSSAQIAQTLGLPEQEVERRGTPRPGD
jgi:DNA-directed RNA polymerase specialized sigma24 family protein